MHRTAYTEDEADVPVYVTDAVENLLRSQEEGASLFT
jgi:hypothetical protein